MSTAQTTRARHGPGRDDIAQAEKTSRARSVRAGDDMDRAEEVDAAPGGLAHLRHVLIVWWRAAFARAKRAVLAKAAAVLDSGIVALERLRHAAGGDADARDECEGERYGPGKRRPREQRATHPDTPQVVAQKPRRLRRLLVHLCVLLAGGMAGMALAYDLLAQLLDRRAAAISRQEIKLSKYSSSVAEFEKKLEREQARRIEAETRLAAGVVQNERNLVDQQAQRAQVEKQLAAVQAAHSMNPPQSEAGGRRRMAGSGQRSRARSADCTLRGSNIRSTLIGCVDELNRH